MTIFKYFYFSNSMKENHFLILLKMNRLKKNKIRSSEILNNIYII